MRVSGRQAEAVSVPEANLDNERVSRVAPADDVGELAVLEHPAKGWGERSQSTKRVKKRLSVTKRRQRTGFEVPDFTSTRRRPCSLSC